ncbi:Uncharacterised protein [Escherichia coli]|uniref:Uncharacterized protein n=5 Tax=Asteriusvirus TaxID=2560094 RepID=A0A1C3S6J1_9CAUD|nr:hypothetical protein [Escherichia coli]YP_009101879.1 hypothetical protein PBI_121Q_292 [Escherichia phage 121Q]AXC37037.1 hypothetical protein [Escherichia phage UB]MED6536230.1 hypothetical protein [Escherichia coli O157]WIL00542.1 hypothetical protein [Escherichia phage vB_EcoM_CRJP21]WPK18484.1 hypothetical protein [Salmonella phage SD-2_S15]WPK19128.1 hypothetical protein [Salmonella phage SD-6_S16]WPK19801.1 hypothetical protein [Salmonella phage SD-1_S14]WPK20824.1 hypothetical pr
MISMKSVQKQIETLSKIKRKQYSLEYTINGNYHLMKENNFIVIDESLQIISIVLKALINDRKKLK